MLLVYIDDSGISYEIVNGLFKDGPYAIYSGLLLNESKYFHTERLFYNAVYKLLGIKDWSKIELHASNIWNRTGSFSSIPVVRVTAYFEELFQLLAKLKLDVTLGIQQKSSKTRSGAGQEKEVENATYAFFSALEHKLSQMNETGILIADETEKKENIQKLLSLRTRWRYNPGARRVSRFKSKFYLETQSCFILDQIHYADSKKSFFLQLSDHVSYVLNRVLTYSYLKTFPKPPRIAEPKEVPITSYTFRFFSSNIFVANFDKSLKDVSLTNMGDLDYDDYVHPNYIKSISEFK